VLTLVRRYSVLITSGALLVLSLGLLIANAQGRRRIDPLGVVFLETITPVASVLRAGSTAIANAWSGYVELVGVRQEREWLRRRVRELEALADDSAEINAENERLHGLLKLGDSLPRGAVAARVAGADVGGLFRTITLNKGEQDGVEKGMAVIAADGVVGRIVSTSPHASRVLLAVDPSSGVDAIVQRTRARGIVEGGSDAGCRLKFVKRREELLVGDRVITSGQDGIFPRGVSIGRIVGVPQDDRGLFQTAEVEPTVDSSKLEEVLVVAAAPREEPPPAGGRQAVRPGAVAPGRGETASPQAVRPGAVAPGRGEAASPEATAARSP
jgi:rod shape-determining protein MreC